MRRNSPQEAAVKWNRDGGFFPLPEKKRSAYLLLLHTSSPLSRFRTEPHLAVTRVNLGVITKQTEPPEPCTDE